MDAFFLPKLKAYLQEKLADLKLDVRSEDIEQTGRSVQIFIGDLPPKKRTVGQAELEDFFPCILLIPTQGQSEQGESLVSVAIIYALYCAEDKDLEAAEMDHAVLLSRLQQALYPLLHNPLDMRYRLVEDAKGRLFFWQKNQEQPRPYLQASLMTNWRMKGME